MRSNAVTKNNKINQYKEFKIQVVESKMPREQTIASYSGTSCATCLASVTTSISVGVVANAHL